MDVALGILRSGTLNQGNAPNVGGEMEKIDIVFNDGLMI